MNTIRSSPGAAVRLAGPILVTVALAPVVWVNAGDLDPPPGAILPTNRVQINDQVDALPFTISQSGSYFLTSSLLGSSGQDGIVIDADDVTLDLNGFTLIGVGGSLDGIRVNGARSHVSVTNGSVRGWGANGINAGSCDNGRFHALSVGNSGIDGIIVGANSIVRNLSVSGNGGAGIHVGGVRNRVDGCHATGNGTGISVQGIENLILRNSASGNGTDFNIVAGNAYGPIVNVGGVGDITSVAAANHPWANFSASCASLMWCRDGDGDGFGDDGDTATGCAPPLGYVGDCTDCDDADPARNPGEIEVCDGIDNDCDMVADNGSSMCGAGDECCNGSCTNVQFDDNNCGSCASACTSGNACCNGVCTDVQSDPGNCGTCGSACGGGSLCCGGVCADVQSDPNNCGACATACESGDSCCAGSCMDLSSDPNNCGSCGSQCPSAPNSTTQCSAGACVYICDSGFEDCNSLPADGCETATSSDPSNCGACGVQCPGGQICQSSICCRPLGGSCASSTDCCAGVCAFGACCQPAGETCTAGADCCSSSCSGSVCD